MTRRSFVPTSESRYRALRLLAQMSHGYVINALAAERGLQSTYRAWPENQSRAMREAEVPVEGTQRQALKEQIRG